MKKIIIFLLIFLFLLPGCGVYYNGMEIIESDKATIQALKVGIEESIYEQIDEAEQSAVSESTSFSEQISAMDLNGAVKFIDPLT